MKHLTPESLQALLDGSLDPVQAAALRQHLEQDCPACAALLQESGPRLDILLRLLEADDGWDQGALAAEQDKEEIWRRVADCLPQQEAAPSPEGNAEIVQLRPPGSPPPQQQRRARWRLPLGAATAVLAMAAALLVFIHDPQPYDGIKGDLPAPPEVHLRVVAGRQSGTDFELTGRLADGDRVAQDLTLLFELETDRLGARYLFVVDGQGTGTQLAPPPGTLPEVEAAGSRRVEQDGSWVALDLGDMQGPLTLVAAASVLPLDADADVMRPYEAGQRPAWLDYDSLSLELDP